MTDVRTPRAIWDYNGWFGASRKIRLKTGVFDEDARDVFCRGHCHSLALALTELIPDADLMGAWEGGELQHVFIRLPDGRYLDGDGFATDERILDGWGADAFTELLDYAELEWAEEAGHLRANRTDDAIPFARTLIERLGVEETTLALAA